MSIKISTDVSAAAHIIKTGRVVGVPTGTSYGLACDALQGHALQRLRNLKERPSEKTFTVFITPTLYDQFLELTSEEKQYLVDNKNKATTLLVKPKTFPDPTTPSLNHLAQDGRVGLRIIDHPLMQEVAEQTQVPLTATSANKSGSKPCYSPDEIQQAFPVHPEGDDSTWDLSLGLILDAGQLSETKPSQIIRLEQGRKEIIR